MSEFLINENCFYSNNNKLYPCKIIDIFSQFGPSIMNNLISSRDYVYTTYYKIQIENMEPFVVTKQFLAKK